MAKYYGVIGYAIQKKGPNSVWVEEIVERTYRGDVLKNTNRWQSADKVNDNIALSDRISIIADPFAQENMKWIRYVNWKGANWKVDSIDIQRPRLILSLGELYNGSP